MHTFKTKRQRAESFVLGAMPSCWLETTLVSDLGWFSTNFKFFPDVVYVGVANHLHKSTVIQALNAKKHVLCEKPMAVNAKEVREMIEAAERNGCFLMEVRVD